MTKQDIRRLHHVDQKLTKIGMTGIDLENAFVLAVSPSRLMNQVVIFQNVYVLWSKLWYAVSKVRWGMDFSVIDILILFIIYSVVNEL